MVRNEKGCFAKDTNKSVVSYKLTDSTKLKLRNVMQMMSANNIINYDEMFSLLADFYIDKTNVKIQNRRRKLTEQKTILEKLEKKIEKKLENIYKEQMKTMWNYLSKFENRKNEQQERIIETQEAEIEQLKKLAKTTSEKIEILLSNDGTFDENFHIFADILKEHCRDLKEYLEEHTKSTDDVLSSHRDAIKTFISNVKFAFGYADEAELKERKQAEVEAKKKREQEEAKLKEERREQEERERKQREQEEANKLRWYKLKKEQIISLGYDYEYGKCYCRTSDVGNAVFALAQPGKDTIVLVKSKSEIITSIKINTAVEQAIISKSIEKEFELLLSGKNYLSFG